MTDDRKGFKSALLASRPCERSVILESMLLLCSPREVGEGCDRSDFAEELVVVSWKRMGLLSKGMERLEKYAGRSC